MEVKLARAELSGKVVKVSLEKLEEKVNEKGQHLFYFDRENTHKEMAKCASYFEGKGKRVYSRAIRYGLGEGEYLYEVHII